MQNIGITKQITQEQKRSLAQICYEAFSKKFAVFLLFDDDADRCAACLVDCINYENCLCAVFGEDILGFAGLDHGKKRFKHFTYRALRKHYGFWGGMGRALSNALFGAFFENVKKGCLHIDAVAVSEQARGKGVGTLLMEASFDEARRLGFQKASLEVINTNPRAQQLYEKLGFVVEKVQQSGRFTQTAGFTSSAYMVKKL